VRGSATTLAPLVGYPYNARPLTARQGVDRTRSTAPRGVLEATRRTMKADLHPEYTEIKILCSCGNEFTTRSTLGKELHIDVCSKCHPFYTGKQKILDTGGRVDKFRRKYGK
jgi:large subunit ribosomal protein L31